MQAGLRRHEAGERAARATERSTPLPDKRDISRGWSRIERVRHRARQAVAAGLCALVPGNTALAGVPAGEQSRAHLSRAAEVERWNDRDPLTGEPSLAGVSSGDDARPNIILMVSDDHGWPYYGFMLEHLRATLKGRDTGICDVTTAPCSNACRDDFYPGRMSSAQCAGPFDPTAELQVETPHLDELVTEGIAFAHGYVADSACTPAYRSLLSGLNVRDLKVARVAKLGCEYGGPQTIPEALDELGYNTLLAGKSWLENPPEFFNDHVCSATTCKAPDPTIRSTKSPTIGENVSLELLKRFIKAQDARGRPGQGHRPWAMIWSPLTPHYSYNNIPEHIRGRYDHVETTNPPHITNNNFGHTSFRSYLEAITYYDERVGELVEFLELLEGGSCDPDPAHDVSRALDGRPTAPKCKGGAGNAERYAGFRSNTLIVYVTDNPAGVQQSKGHFSENGLRTPIILNYPNRIPPTGIHEALVGAIDIFPTILDYARHGGGPGRVFPDAMSLRGIAEDPSTYPDQGRRHFFSNASTDGNISVVDSVPAHYDDDGPKVGRSKVVAGSSPRPVYSSVKRVSNVTADPFEVLWKAKPDTFVTAADSCLVKYGAEAGPDLDGKSTVQHLLGMIHAWDNCSADCRRWLVEEKLTAEACGGSPAPPPAGCSAATTLCKDPTPSGFSPIDCS